MKSIYEKICAYLMIAIGDGAGNSYIFNIQDFCRRERLFPATVLGAIDLLDRNEYISYIEVADNPARMIFRVGRDDLYRYQMSANVERVMRTMLRMYNGLFTEFRAIDEEVVAAACEMSREQVHQVLRELWRSHIIRYVPANSSPMIYMHEERLPVESLYISPKSYGYRKEQMIGRLRSMVEYAENRDICRSVIISKHFGDSGATECGCCDICLAKKRKQSKETVEKLEQDVECQIVEALKDGELTLRQIARAVAASPESVTDALYRLVESGKIAIKKPDIFYIIPTGGRKG